jgi:hypothetical protein
MTWRLEFYSEGRQVLARYVVDAVTPALALELGRRALLTDYQPAPARPPRSLFERARRLGGEAADGWVLYRIAQDG